MKADDEKLIADFLSGERAAIAQIEGWLRQAAFRYRRSLDMPWEDVQQDLLLEVTDTLQRGAFRGDCQLKTFLWRVAHYGCLNLLREQARQGQRDFNAETESLHSPGRSPLEQVMKNESVDELTRFMEAMPECRELWMMILGGKSYREMSQELGVSAGSLRVKVLRCRKKAFARWQSWRSRLPAGNIPNV